MQAPFDLPADLDTPVSAYMKLAPLGARFLLESAAGPERTARYSFLGFGEGAEIVLDPDGLRLDGGPLPVPADRSGLLAFLRSALERAPELAHPELPLPFRGGLAGVVGYDFVRRLERLPPPRASAHPELRLLAPRSLLVFDHQRRTAALFHGGSDAERARLRSEVLRCLAGPLPRHDRPRGFTPPRASLAREEFVERVRRAQEAILDGELYQLVLSISSEGETDLTPLELYRALRFLNPSPYMVLFEFGDLAVIGASPEALVRLEHGRALLQPIAGTRRRGEDPARDRELERELLADPKEAAEHVMLVDLARNDLGRVARPRSIAVEPFSSVERYSHVMHLVSGVTGELEAGQDGFELFASCFPAGTVVGAPKLRAIEWIDELEPEARGLYGGSVGYFGKGGALDQALLIRSLFLARGRYRLQAGAGVVALSRPEAEYAEVAAKSEALHRALELAAEGLP